MDTNIQNIYIACLGKIMSIYNKQHLSNTEVELKKRRVSKMKLFAITT